MEEADKRETEPAEPEPEHVEPELTEDICEQPSLPNVNLDTTFRPFAVTRYRSLSLSMSWN